MIYVFLGLRALLIVICIECSAHYALWWRKVGREESDPQNLLLLPLLIGIAIAQAGIALRHVDILYYEVAPDMIGTVLLSDILMMVGTAFHLFPAWRISRGLTGRQIRTAVCIRILIAAALAGVVILYDLHWWLT